MISTKSEKKPFKYDLIDRSNHAKVYHFANNSVMLSMETLGADHLTLEGWGG